MSSENSTCEIILIRHGQSIGNLKRIYLGHTDWDLSDLGKEQAQLCADYFKDEKITAVYTSDLLRAYNTAKPHAILHNLTVNPMRILREVHVGAWEGQPVDSIIENWHDEFVIEWTERFGTSTPPGGEPVFEAGKRMYNALLDIARNNVGGKVLVAAHAAIIRAFWCYANAVEPEKWADYVPFPNNASASFVSFDGEKLVTKRFSFNDYLPSVSDKKSIGLGF